MRRMLEAFGEIDERYLVSAMMCERRPIKRWGLRVAAMAACLCLMCVAGVRLWKNVNPDAGEMSGEQVKYPCSLGEEFSVNWGEAVFTAHTDTTAKVSVKNTSETAQTFTVSITADYYNPSSPDMIKIRRVAQLEYREDCMWDAAARIQVFIDGHRVGYHELIIPADGEEHEITIDFSRISEEKLVFTPQNLIFEDVYCSLN